MEAYYRYKRLKYEMILKELRKEGQNNSKEIQSSSTKLGN